MQVVCFVIGNLLSNWSNAQPHLHRANIWSVIRGSGLFIKVLAELVDLTRLQLHSKREDWEEI